MLLLSVSNLNAAAYQPPNQLAQFYAIGNGTDVGMAEACNFGKTKEFTELFKKAIYATKWKKEDQDYLWKLFQDGRKAVIENPEINNPTVLQFACEQNKGILDESPIWQKGYEFGD